MFPFQDRLLAAPNFEVSVSDVIQHIGPQLTPERRATIDRVVQGRTYSAVLVLEDIYDRGNASAVFRSAEAMGYGRVHMIQIGEKLKESQRTTAGADKWLEIQQWKSTKACIDALKSEGKQIVVTHLDASSVPIDAVDFSKPSAIVLGNEKNGVSPEMIAAADHRVILPMKGFVQSFNISVAGALALWHVMKDRERRLGAQGDLTAEQQRILKAVYYLRTQDSAVQTLQELHRRSSEN